MLLKQFITQLILGASLVLGQYLREWQQRPLSWWQKQYYQSRWRQRLRFTTTPLPGATAEWHEVRMVYPCYCYKPKLDSSTKSYEKYMVENKDIFILNK